MTILLSSEFKMIILFGSEYIPVQLGSYFHSLSARFECGSSKSVSGGSSIPGSIICVSDASEGCKRIVLIKLL